MIDAGIVDHQRDIGRERSRPGDVIVAGDVAVAAVAGGEGDQVHAVQLVAGVAPGVAGGGLDDADEEQR